jgi:hypothetical protein
MSSRISELSMKQNSRPLRLFSDVHTCDDAVCAAEQRVRGQLVGSPFGSVRIAAPPARYIVALRYI